MPPMDGPMPPDVGNPMPPEEEGGEEPPMNAPGQGDEEMPDDGDMPDDNGDMPDDGGNPAKKEIQKLAGKLSQKMSEYNSENGSDEELNKFVGGMIFKQLNLDDADKDSILNKADSPEMDDESDMEGEPDMDDEPDMEDKSDMEDVEDGGKMEKDAPRKGGKPMKAESIDRIISRVISEITNDATDFTSNDKTVFDRGTERPDRKERTDASKRSPFRGRRN